MDLSQDRLGNEFENSFQTDHSLDVFSSSSVMCSSGSPVFSFKLMTTIDVLNYVASVYTWKVLGKFLYKRKANDETKREQDKQCTYNVTLRCVRVTIVPAEKAISIKYYECVCVCVLLP